MSAKIILALCFLSSASLSLCSRVHFEANLTWETRAPDGNPRQIILTNGQFPGPALELDYGDEVEVKKICRPVNFLG